MPNEDFAKTVQDLHEQLKNEVFEAWEELYRRQEGLLEWPDDVAAIADIPPPQEIDRHLRELYRDNVVLAEWQRVFEIVDLRRQKVEEADDAAEPMERGGRPEIQYEGLVSWPDNDRYSIVQRYLTASTPSTNRVRLTQEDLWVFEALANIVVSTNDGATDALNAPIKGIESLDVAQFAMQGAGDGGSTGSGGGMAGGGMGGMAGGMGGMAGGMGGMAGGGAGDAQGGDAAAASAKSEDDKLLIGRYLDERGRPIDFNAPQPFAEFKQIFVRMKFVMDQRRIPDLLAQCANAPIPVEVRRVRITFGLSGGDVTRLAGGQAGGGGGGNMGGMAGGGMGGMAGGMGGMAGGMGGMAGGMGGMAGGMGGMAGGMGGMAGGMGGMAGGRMGGMAGGRGGMAGGGMGGGGGMASSVPVETGPYDAVVEVCGVVYIYNRPEKEKLGTGSAADPSQRVFALPQAAAGS
ncbi:MAG: hypothetical protein WD847_19720 [Pirellulales bacterium]